MKQRWSREFLLNHLYTTHTVWFDELTTASRRRLRRFHRWVHEIETAAESIRIEMEKRGEV